MPLSIDFPGLFLADTITKLPGDAGGCVVLTGSHGGRYPGYLAAIGGARGAIFNDAGIGKDEAGVAALADLERISIPAATVSCMSCRIGDASDALARGTVSRMNAQAKLLGVLPGLSCRRAAAALRAAHMGEAEPQPFGEARSELPVASGRRILFLDSASLVRPEDRAQIVVTGSHGGLVGGDPAAALRVEAFAAVFNDAGEGIDGAGFSRLPPLDIRGIAAFTVAAASARIGEARSTYADGTVSRANETARRLGVRAGEPALSAIHRLAQM